MCDVDLVRLRQHGDGDGGGVDAARAFGLRHALHAVHAALELEPAVRALPFDGRDDLLQPAEPGLTGAQDLDAPAPRLGIARVHAEELGGEEARLLAAGAGADLEQHAAIVVRVARQQQHLQLGFERVVLELQAGKLLEREGADVLVGIVQKRLVALDLLLQLLPRPIAMDDLLDSRTLLAELRELFAVGDDVGRDEQILELDVSRLHRG